MSCASVTWEERGGSSCIAGCLPARQSVNCDAVPFSVARLRCLVRRVQDRMWIAFWADKQWRAHQVCTETWQSFTLPSPVTLFYRVFLFYKPTCATWRNEQPCLLKCLVQFVQGVGNLRRSCISLFLVWTEFIVWKSFRSLLVSAWLNVQFNRFSIILEHGTASC
jgi:hypothetical protein